MSEVLLRDARADEAEALLALWTAADAVPSITDNLSDLLRVFANPGARILVGETDGELIGSVVGTFDGWRANIYRLAVHPDHRRRGIATRLMKSIEDWLAEVGAKRVSALTVRAHPWAVGFWDASGFDFDDRIVRYVRTL